jgi:hypothetical protein
MTNEEISEALEKLRYQVSLLGETIDHKVHPVEALVLGMDWARGDLEKAHDIFEKWDKRLAKGEAIKSYEFEADFSNDLGISYQGLKSVVLAFYRNGQWTDVCEAYVDSFGKSPAIEYHTIMRRERG